MFSLGSSCGVFLPLWKLEPLSGCSSGENSLLGINWRNLGSFSLLLIFVRFASLMRKMFLIYCFIVAVSPLSGIALLFCRMYPLFVLWTSKLCLTTGCNPAYQITKFTLGISLFMLLLGLFGPVGTRSFSVKKALIHHFVSSFSGFITLGGWRTLGGIILCWFLKSI